MIHLKPSTASSVRELLGTEQYLLVHVNSASISIERNLPDGQCPVPHGKITTLTPTWNNPSSVPRATVMLSSNVSDPSIPPKLLVVQQFHNRLAYAVLPIDFPHKAAEGHAVFTKELSLRNRHIFSQHGLIVSHYEFIGVMYDYRTKFLYVLFENANKVELTCELFLMEERGDKWDADFLFQFSASSVFFNSTWSSDYATHRVYYSQEIYQSATGKTIVELRWIHFDEIVTRLKEGIAGTLLATSERQAYPMKMFAVHNLLYKIVEGEKTIGRHLISLSNRAEQMRCFSDSATGNTNDMFFVIADWEFCKLRDGSSANKTICAEKSVVINRNVITSVPQHADRSFGWGLSFFIVTSVILNAVLFFCIGYWVIRRSNDKGMYVLSRPYGDASMRLHDKDLSF